MAYLTVGSENSGNIDLYFEDHGAGHPVILIHGYPLSSASWERQVSALLAADFRAIVYDRRGFGKSSQPTVGYNYDTFAEDLYQLINKLALKNFSLIGFSMGGGEVARYIGRYGTKGVTKAVIIGGVPPYLLKTADNPSGLEQQVFDDIQKNVAADRYAFFRDFFKNFYNTDVFLNKRISQASIDASWNIAAMSSAAASFACVPSWHEDFRKDLSCVNIPLLVIHGDADRIVPINASAHRVIETVKHARLHAIHNGPHAITWTHADEVNDAIIKFLLNG